MKLRVLGSSPRLSKSSPEILEILLGVLILLEGLMKYASVALVYRFVCSTFNYIPVGKFGD